MPSVVGHFAVPAAIRVARAMPVRVLVAGFVASMLPDADTIGLPLGVPQHGIAGHRGLTHSIVFAVAVATLASIALAPRSTRSRSPVDGMPSRAAGPRGPRRARWHVFAFLLACTASHPLLDALTDGGPGVMLGWPFSTARVFAPWRPIEVSPIGAGFFSARGLVVVASELVWVLLPAFALALTARLMRGRGR